MSFPSSWQMLHMRKVSLPQPWFRKEYLDGEQLSQPSQASPQAWIPDYNQEMSSFQGNKEKTKDFRLLVWYPSGVGSRRQEATCSHWEKLKLTEKSGEERGLLIPKGPSHLSLTPLSSNITKYPSNTLFLICHLKLSLKFQGPSWYIQCSVFLFTLFIPGCLSANTLCPNFQRPHPDLPFLWSPQIS